MDTVKTGTDLTDVAVSNIDDMKGRFLTFLVDRQIYGIPISDVVQIVGVQEITTVPDFPSYAKGIINLRGSIIPLIDMRLRFGKEELPYNERTCIIVTNIDGHQIGLIVESVEEVATIPDGEISPPPVVSSENANTYITGVGLHEEKIVLLLNTQKILAGSEIDELTQGDLAGEALNETE
jgi:purine-binding chemotaxis protein CheW